MSKQVNNKVWVAAVVAAVLVIAGAVAWSFYQAKDEESNNNAVSEDSSLTDAERFKAEYPEVAADNRFVYATSEEVLSIFESGTGLVYLGFEECPWCQKISTRLDEAAKEEGLDKIHYLDIRSDRQSGSEAYEKLVEVLSQYLETDENGEPRIYVPDVTAVKDGEIVGRFEMEEPTEDEPFTGPDDYWTEARSERAIASLRQLIGQIVD